MWGLQHWLRRQGRFGRFLQGGADRHRGGHHHRRCQRGGRHLGFASVEHRRLWQPPLRLLALARAVGRRPNSSGGRHRGPSIGALLALIILQNMQRRLRESMLQLGLRRRPGPGAHRGSRLQAHRSQAPDARPNHGDAALQGVDPQSPSSLGRAQTRVQGAVHRAIDAPPDSSPGLVQDVVDALLVACKRGGDDPTVDGDSATIRRRRQVHEEGELHGVIEGEHRDDIKRRELGARDHGEHDPVGQPELHQLWIGVLALQNLEGFESGVQGADPCAD
mmetsp:Transcript_86133/g.278258  ORF Transcript_86133/g.278258 Transcript_86133/m.278258 type:complete len:277 (+) Transcript_86133:216-1046(+)